MNVLTAVKANKEREARQCATASSTYTNRVNSYVLKRELHKARQTYATKRRREIDRLEAVNKALQPIAQFPDKAPEMSRHANKYQRTSRTVDPGVDLAFDRATSEHEHYQPRTAEAAVAVASTSCSKPFAADLLDRHDDDGNNGGADDDDGTRGSKKQKLIGMMPDSMTFRIATNVAALVQRPALLQDFVAMRSLQRQRQDVQQERKKWERGLEAFDAQVRQLVINDVATLVHTSHLCNGEPEVFSLDVDRCRDCGRIFSFSASTFTKVCFACRQVHRTLLVAEDSTADILVFRNQRTAIVTRLDKEQVVSEQGVNGKDDKRITLPSRDRIATFRQLLQQFVTTAVMDTKEVDALKTSLVAHHIHIPSTVRMTHVTQIDSKAPCRLYRYFTGQSVPVLTQSLVDELVTRFEVIIQVAIDTNTRGAQLPSLECVAHLLLRMCGHRELATAFEIPKHSSVLNRTAEQWDRLVCAAANRNPDRKWPRVRLA